MNDLNLAKRYFLALLASVALSASSSVILTGCGNNFRGISSSSLSTTSGTNGTTGVTGTSGRDSFIISSVAITTPSSGSSSSSGGTGGTTTGGTVGTAKSTTGIFFNTTQSTTTINSRCNTADTSGNSTSKPCLCQFTWNETNPNSPNNLPVTRTVQTSVTTVQPSFIGCSAPDVYSTEIPAGTGIRVTVVAAPGNSDLGNFTVNSYVFKVPTSTIGGAFSDGAGNIFDNILHYSCYGKNQKGLTITSKSRTVTSPSTGATATALYGTKFCIASSSGGGGSSSCNNPPADYSAQSYYFNLFVRSTEKGDINQFNSSFICPLVRESLHNTNTIGTQNQPWPLDQSFALSTTPTSVFAVGVQANIKLSGGADPTAVANTCFPTEGSSGSGSSNTNSIISACLGFAARPNSNGTCPSISDSTGKLRPTYRLRRYLGIYPMLFDTTGIPLSTPQSVDTIYVLDRPVTAPSTANPLQPYTMLGPKPCPFAFFDTKNVTGLSKPQYHGTSDAAWSGKNFDGIEFPNRDNSESCSASLPILSDDGSMFSISTVNFFNDTSTGALKHVWVRPQQPFFPHYEEDTNFLACAPQASPVHDPPLHFSRDPYSGNVAWCAESYPTQNPNVGPLDPPDSSFNASGLVVPYTSHVVKRTTNAPCTPSVVNVVSTSTYTYPSGGAASHPNTITLDPDPDASLPAGSLKADKSCDRTATSAGLAWPRFPLLAPASAVETSINTDKSYFCTVTYDAGGGKQGISTPAGGCCNSGIVQVTTGTQGGSTAHLEPTVACGQPQY